MYAVQVCGRRGPGNGAAANTRQPHDHPKVQRIIGQRLKQAGTRWTVKRADAIIALHCKEASSQWEAIDYRRHNQR